MFVKLVVLILVCGSSGVGLLSVRQSRLQAAHEMAEARHRTHRLDEQAREIRTRIAQACTPDRVIALLGAQSRYVSAVHRRAKLSIGADRESTPEVMFDQEQPAWMDDAFEAQHAWILEDGAHVILLND